jgi:23S rRNA (cytosine1962-C5)-methyltransferase
MPSDAIVTNKGARRWAAGHPWIFRSDVAARPDLPAGAVRVRDVRGADLGWALWSPTSEISLRLLDRRPDAVIDDGWWHDRIAHALARREPLAAEATAYRLIHGEGDGLPSLVCDRYARWLVVQLMSAGLERFREPIVSALRELTGAAGILARNDVPLRSREALPRDTSLLHWYVLLYVYVL